MHHRAQDGFNIKEWYLGASGFAPKKKGNKFQMDTKIGAQLEW